MDARQAIMYYTQTARQQQRATEFIHMSKTSLCLCGKTAETLCGCDDKRKLHEIELTQDELPSERYEGDAVTAGDVFTSSENAVWEGKEVHFKLEEGVLLTSAQYEYVQKYGPLAQYSYFARSNNKDSTVPRTWKEISRRSRAARRDKAKDILYLTVGTVTWIKEEGTDTKPAEKAVSPLLLCPITEDALSRERPRFLITADTVKVNGLLARELKRRGFPLFLNVPDEVPFGKQMLSALRVIEDNAKYMPHVEVNINSINICVLDSTNESICQLIEKNVDQLARSPLMRLFSGEIEYDEVPKKPITPHAIYPLFADDSQREVIAEVLNGHSQNVSAAAGTGKSQTAVNIAANLAIHGKKLCVMSEKAAANEVFINEYAASVGLDKFCLILDNRMTVSQIIGQLDKIRNTARVYVDPIRARDLLSETAEIEELLDGYQRAVYSVIPSIDMNLYELIGEAIAEDACEDVSDLYVERDGFRLVCRKLDELQENINNAVSDKEFSDFLESGSAGDEEVDELLQDLVAQVRRCGVDIVSFINKNRLPHDRFAAITRANLARILANELVAEYELGKFGNVFLRAKYAKLTECYAKYRSLCVAFMRQQLSERITEAVREDKELIPLLERIKTSKMSVKDFFKKYAGAVMKLCPIIVTTPTVAANYMTDEMNSFDTLLIDEASQVPIVNVLPFLCGDKNLVVFGDNMQLDITSFFHTRGEDAYDEEGEFDMSRTDKSVLHLVQGKGVPGTRLLYHYRSKVPQLFETSNHFCYNDMLNMIPAVYTDWEHLPEHLGPKLHRVHVPFDPASARASARLRKGKDRMVTEYPYLESHVKEVADTVALEVAEYAAKIKTETPEKSIGVVTLNDAFHDKVLDAMEGNDVLAPYLIEEEGIWVRSIENAQGREADVILIAIEHDRRNVKGVLQKNISGFFNAGEQNEQSGNNRLNVMFSRSREKYVVFHAFGHDEIRNTDRSLKRLHTYLEHAATGYMPGSAETDETQDKPNLHAAKVVSEALSGSEVRSKIGSGTMMVDIAVIDGRDESKYAVGFMLPDRRISLNTLFTKINLLERAGWRVLPLSLIYLLEKKEAFRKQLPHMIENDRPLGSVAEENYLISSRPSMPITLEEITLRRQLSELSFAEEEVAQPKIQKLGFADLVGLGVESVCRTLCDEDIQTASQDYIDGCYKQNTQALLVKLAQNVHRVALREEGEKLEALTRKAYYLYKNLGEKRCCYLLAQLLRVSAGCEQEDNQRLIRMLLDEAEKMRATKESA